MISSNLQLRIHHIVFFFLRGPSATQPHTLFTPPTRLPRVNHAFLSLRRSRPRRLCVWHRLRK